VKLETAKYILQCPDGWNCQVLNFLAFPEIIFINGKNRIIHSLGFDGNLSRVIYANSTGYHRPPCEGPALVYYSSSGKILGEEYYFNGQLHRDPLVGPAIKNYYKNGNVKSEFYYVRGVRVIAPS
jgi:hypothetical protein